MKSTTRKVVARSPGRTVRLVNLPHPQPDPSHIESGPERDFARNAEHIPRTMPVGHQPLKVELPIGGYTPDLLLTFLNGSRLEVEAMTRICLGWHTDVLAETESSPKAHEIPVSGKT